MIPSHLLEDEPQRTAGTGPISAKILVADDDPHNLLALEEILRAPGCDLVIVRSGEEALRQVLREDFALILLDVQMPRMDGYEVAHMIRSRPRSSRVPIIFLTAYNKDELHVFRGYTAGAVDYVFKPIEPIVLQSKVSVFVELYRKTEEIRQQAQQERALLMDNLRVRGEKLQTERELRRAQERQEAILRSLPVVLTSRGTEAPFPALFVSDNVERLTGFPAERFTADQSFGMSRIHPEDADRVHLELASARVAGQYSCEYRWECADGQYRHFLDQGVLAGDQEGIAEIFGTMFDVTDRRNLEERLLHGSKLEAIGQLTGGIAHDFNNMLSVVMGSLELLQRTLGDNEIGRKRVRIALDGAQRCADLTNRLLSFARRQPLQASVVDLAVFGSGLMELLRRTLGDHIQLSMEAAPGLWPVSVDPSQLESALINLAVNSRDAMPEGGRLTVRMRNAHEWEADLPPSLKGDLVVISVSDSGLGMTPEVQNRVFEPFFTTKDVGRGTGLGLSMTYGFVKQSGGDIEIRSAPGRGTDISLFLPRTNLQPEQSDMTTGQEPRRGNGELILVVEDDPQVRDVTISAVEVLGYRALAAENGTAALSMLKGRDGIRAVFSDVNMPGSFSGFQLAREVQRRWPHIKTLLTSGYIDENSTEPGFDILHKPYRTEDLARTLQTLFAEDMNTQEQAVAFV